MNGPLEEWMGDMIVSAKLAPTSSFLSVTIVDLLWLMKPPGRGFIKIEIFGGSLIRQMRGIHSETDFNSK